MISYDISSLILTDILGFGLVPCMHPKEDLPLSRCNWRFANVNKKQFSFTPHHASRYLKPSSRPPPNPPRRDWFRGMGMRTRAVANLSCFHLCGGNVRHIFFNAENPWSTCSPHVLLLLPNSDISIYRCARMTLIMSLQEVKRLAKNAGTYDSKRYARQKEVRIHIYFFRLGFSQDFFQENTISYSRV